MSERDRPKKSWREIDATRDRGRGGSPPAVKLDESSRASKQYRAQLDALFAKGELGKLAEKLASRTDVREPPVATPPTPVVAPADELSKAVKSERAALRKKIVEAADRAEMSRALDRYVKSFGMPEDFELLEQALEHQKPERIHEALVALDTLLAHDKPKRSRSLAGKLRFIEETQGDGELQALAARVRAKLS